MKAKAEAQPARLDGLKWALVVLLVSAAVLGNMYFSDAPLLYRVVGVVALVALVALLLWLIDSLLSWIIQSLIY